tara:strand:+ start:5721 stop:6008 length:288 start_codon:yes stop_codon:yes gene_type:complete
MSRADDGARPVLVGGVEEDAGITSHGVTRASMLRPGQKLALSHTGRPDAWHTLKTVTERDNDIVAKSANVTWTFPKAEIVRVRDILHTYTESETQ